MRGSKHRQLHMQSALKSLHNEAVWKTFCASISFSGLCISSSDHLSVQRGKKANGSRQLLASLFQQLCASAAVGMHVSGFYGTLLVFLSFPAKSQNPFHKSRRRATTSAGERHLVKQYKTTFYYRGTSLLFNEYNPNMLLLMNNLRRRAHPGVTGEQEESYKERVYDFSCSTYN